MKLMKQTQVKQNQTRPWNETAFHLKSNELSNFECIKRKEIISNHQDIKMLCKKGIGEKRTSPQHTKSAPKGSLQALHTWHRFRCLATKTHQKLATFHPFGTLSFATSTCPTAWYSTLFFPGKNRRFATQTLSRSSQNVLLSHLRSWNTKHRNQQRHEKRGRLKRKRYPENRQSNICLIKLIFTQSQWISKSWWSKRLTVTQASQGPQKMALPSLRLASARCEEKTLQILDHTCVLYICHRVVMLDMCAYILHHCLNI